MKILYKLIPTDLDRFHFNSTIENIKLFFFFIFFQIDIIGRITHFLNVKRYLISNDYITSGIKRVLDNTNPTCGNFLFAGMGSKILGPISIGNFVFIGANSDVTYDFGSNSIFAGLPAKFKCFYSHDLFNV